MGLMDRSRRGVPPAKKGCGRVLLIYRRMIPSIRLCGHCQLEHLAGRGRLEYRAVQEMKLKAADLNWADTVLLGRLDNWYEYQLVKRLRAAGKYLIYVLDDDLLNIPAEISSAAYYGRPEIQKYIREMMRLSDAILSPSPLLLKKYAVEGRRAIQIEEPAIDPVEYRPHDPKAPVKIGFAGSIDRTGDLERLLGEALIRIKRAYGDRVAFEFFGAIPSFADQIGAKCIPYCDSYDEYRRTLNERGWDIGLAPMPDTPFHACKHYNKFVEYAAAGIVGVYSKVEPYTRLKDTDILVFAEEEDWYSTVERLLKDRTAIEFVRQKSVSFVQTRMNVSEVSNELWKQLQPIRLYQEQSRVAPPGAFIRIQGLVKRICNKTSILLMK